MRGGRFSQREQQLTSFTDQFVFFLRGGKRHVLGALAPFGDFAPAVLRCVSKGQND